MFALSSQVKKNSCLLTIVYMCVFLWHFNERHIAKLGDRSSSMQTQFSVKKKKKTSFSSRFVVECLFNFDLLFVSEHFELQSLFE